MNIFKNIIHILLFPYFKLDKIFSKTQSLSYSEKSLLVIKMDAIGDYLLFSDYLKAIRKSKKYRDYKISLIGNSIWKDFFLSLNAEDVDEVIWINRNSYLKNIIYRIRIVNQLRLKSYSILYQPTYSREYYFVDHLVNLISAKKKITVKCDNSNIKKWQLKISKNYYDEVINTDILHMFEMDRNSYFTEKFIDEKLIVENINESNKEVQEINKFCFFIGGSQRKRRWSTKNYNSLIKELQNQCRDIQITLIGGPLDFEDSLEICKGINEIENLVGKKSLLQTIDIIKNTGILISNESFAPHLSAKYNIPTLVISNGNHYKRFCPYPKSIFPNYHVVFPEELNVLNENDRIKKFYMGSDLNINSIKVNDVFSELNKLTSSLNN